MKIHGYDITIERLGPGYWSASCPEIPGCRTFASNKKEAVRNIREAVELHVEGLNSRDRT